MDATTEVPYPPAKADTHKWTEARNIYLGSDESSWVTGVALRVDGGLATGIWGG